jgi:acyl-CoA reductase-like NAD-dependent aldehyde dehydrogenase
MNKKFEKIATVLLNNLIANKDSLVKQSMLNTGNMETESNIDLGYSLGFLENFKFENIPNNLKPKGKVFIILSFNEPLLLSIIPIFCALATGNKVFVRPSSKNKILFKSIWQPVIDDTQIDLSVLNIEVSEYEEYIKEMKSVYFFGSFQHAKNIYNLCSKYFVEFIPEVETSDCKLLNHKSMEESEIISDIKSTIISSFEHDGKICQRICGTYINSEIYDNYREHLIDYLSSNSFEKISKDILSAEVELEKDIIESNPVTIYRNKDEFVVISPNENSNYVKKGYFNKSLWIIKYSDKENLIETLKKRNFYLGLNIISKNNKFIKSIIDETNFSRYTLNSNHCDISNDTGWGGNWPSGVGGYKTWYETFSNKYQIIK